MGLGGTAGGGGLSYGSFLDAIDYKTGKVAWRHEIGGTAGFLTTAGKLLFGGDGENLVAWDPTNGKPLWHARIGSAGNAPETFMLDGRQYILATGGDQLYAFVLKSTKALDRVLPCFPPSTSSLISLAGFMKWAAANAGHLLKLAARITSAHFSVSSAISLMKSSRGPTRITPPICKPCLLGYIQLIEFEC